MQDFEHLKLNNQLCFAMYAATNAITQAYRQQLSLIGLTYPQYLVLLLLWQSDGMGVREIAQQLRLEAATISPLLKRLEKSGFIVRQRDAQDQRNVKVFLTDQGHAIQVTVSTIQQKVACQTGLSDMEYQGLRDTLHALISTIQSNDVRIKAVA